MKSKCVHRWLYIKGRDMFVCILFCGFNRKSVHEPSSLTTVATSTPRDFKSNTFQRQNGFYLTQTNEMNTGNDFKGK